MLPCITISEYGSGRIRRAVGPGMNPVLQLWNFVLAYNKLIQLHCSLHSATMPFTNTNLYII